MGRVKTLDGWRAISVGLVIFDHLAAFSSIHTGPNEWLFALGRLGVQIFFVISGFVICRGLIREASEFGGVSLVGFYIRRFFRIVPPLILYIATICVLAIAGVVDQHAIGAVRATTFTCNFPAADCGGYLGAHTWSLSVEEQFYLVIPAVFLFLNRRRKIATASLVAVPIVIVIFGPNDAAGFAINFLPISVGVAWALNEDWVRRACYRAPGWLPYVVMIALIGILRLTFTRFWPPAYIVEAALIAVMLMLSISNRFAVLSSAPMVAMGRSSYGIYLWQQLATASFPGASAAFYAGSTILCVAGSLIMFATVERRLIAFGHKLSSRKSPGGTFSSVPASFDHGSPVANRENA